MGKCQIFNEERNALSKGMRTLKVFHMEAFGKLESSEKTIAIIGNRWWPQTAKQDRDRTFKHFRCRIRKKRDESPIFGGVVSRSRDVPKRCSGQRSND